MLTLNVGGMTDFASQIRAHKAGLNETHASYWSNDVLGDWSSNELEAAFTKWMYGWATEVGNITALAMHIATECEQVAAALISLDNQAGSIFSAQFD